MSQRDDDGAGQGRQIDHGGRLEAFLRIPKHIGQHEPPLGIGIDDLDRVALHGFHDIARTLGAAVGHVLDQTDQTDDIGPGAAQRQRAHDARDDTGAPHVHGHLLHAGGGLDRDAAGIKDHALADQRQRRLVLGATIPAHDHDLGRAFRTLPDPQQRPHTQFRQLVLVQHLDADAQLAHGQQAVGEIAGGQHIGRLADQIAGKEDALGQRRAIGGGLAQGLGVLVHEIHPAAFGGLILGAIFGFAALVGREIIGPQRQPQRDLGGAGMVGGGDQQVGLAQFRTDGGAGLARGQRVGIARQVHQLQRLGAKTGRKGQIQRLAGLHALPRIRGQRPQRRLARRARQAGGQLAVLRHQNGDAARPLRQPRQIGLGEGDFHRMGHGPAFRV